MTIFLLLAENGYIPWPLLRLVIRAKNRTALRWTKFSPHEFSGYIADFITEMSRGPVARKSVSVNQASKDAPAAFFNILLGPLMKFSCCLFQDKQDDLGQAERAMLELICKRAGIEPGMKILDLGCGWGALSFYIAENYPDCQIAALTNSESEIHYITRQAEKLGIDNIDAALSDVSGFEAEEQFDRILSIEMIEHLNNYKQFLRDVSGWLKPDGKFFVHHYCHKSTPYSFDSDMPINWTGRHFFTGSIMPSASLLENFQNDLRIENRWTVNGMNYYRTVRAWIENLDGNQRELTRVLKRVLPEKEAAREMRRWKIFLTACSELWRVNKGGEWFVAQYLFRKA